MSLIKKNKKLLILLVGLGIVIELLTLAADLSLISNPLASSSSDTLRIQFTGELHNWQFLYPGKEGVFYTRDDVKIIDLVNLFLPSNKEILFELRSKDYFYCLDIPELEKSQIAVPDMLFKLNFYAGKPETLSLFPGAICGTINDNLNRKINIVSNHEFNNWLENN